MQQPPVKLQRSDARQCLRTMNKSRTHTYLAGVYGSAADAAVSAWHWRLTDVIWLDLLDREARDCVLSHGTQPPAMHGLWVAHKARGFFLPPLGSKMAYPVLWQYRSELSCFGKPSSTSL